MSPSSTNSYYRLIALWVVCEAFIGGIIHGLHIPISGLVVGSAAVTCISLIGWYHPSKGSIIRATLVVLIFKMLLSPQAPITAYVAVLFQGLLGELLFRNRKYFSAAAICFAVIALMESAFQRFLIMTIIYGNNIWTAINEMMNKITGQENRTNYSNWFIAAYSGIHLIAGLLVGYGIAGLPSKIEKWKTDPKINEPIAQVNEEKGAKPGKKTWLWMTCILLILLLVQSNYGPGGALLPRNTIVHLITRSAIIIAGWILLVDPLIKWLLHYWLKKKEGKLKFEMESVISLLPEVHQLLRSGAQIASRMKGWKKYSRALRFILVHSLSEEAGRIYILSAPKGSGKTSSLKEWARNRNDVHGLLSPVLEGKRMFLDLSTNEEFAMEAMEGKEKVLKVGKYIFSQRAFAKAINILDKARQQNGWLIIDEVGPLELRGEGLNEVIMRCLERNGNMIIVTREGLEEQVNQFIQANAIIIHSVHNLPT